jgi:hypothetical protein
MELIPVLRLKVEAAATAHLHVSLKNILNIQSAEPEVVGPAPARKLIVDNMVKSDTGPRILPGDPEPSTQDAASLAQFEVIDEIEWRKRVERSFDSYNGA